MGVFDFFLISSRPFKYLSTPARGNRPFIRRAVAKYDFLRSVFCFLTGYLCGGFFSGWVGKRKGEMALSWLMGGREMGGEDRRWDDY